MEVNVPASSRPAGEIGFGTANLYGGTERAKSVALVRAAVEAGLRWIDTAPLYGHGAAEAIVGEAIAGHRDGLILVSKAGILPSRITAGYRLHARAARLIGKLPGGRSLLPPPPPRRPRFNVFAPGDVRKSVERSLRALGTDRLDFLLLHEIDPASAEDPALIDTLERLVLEGKLLGFGTATQADQTLRIIASAAATRFALFQMAPCGSAAPPMPDGARIVLHSLLGERLRQVLGRLRSDAGLRAMARGLCIDPDQPDLGRRLIACALRRGHVRAVLFSTSDIRRLRSAARAGDLSQDEAEAGMKLLAGAMAHA